MLKSISPVPWGCAMREGMTERHCPRCGGNVYLEKDFYGWFEKCLQCGYNRDLPRVIGVRGETDRTAPDALRESPETSRKAKR